MYGCETRAVGKPVIILEAFEMWCYGRMFKIKWTYKIRNEKVLKTGEQ